MPFLDGAGVDEVEAKLGKSVRGGGAFLTTTTGDGCSSAETSEAESMVIRMLSSLSCR